MGVSLPALTAFPGTPAVAGAFVEAYSVPVTHLQHRATLLITTTIAVLPI